MAGIRAKVVTTTVGDKATWLSRLARSVAGIEGDAAECGVFQGGSLRLIAEALRHKTVFGFDTFSGLPTEAWVTGEPHKVGDFSDNSLALAQSHVSDLANVILVQGVFPKSAEPYSHNRFSFVYIDFDYYLSTRSAINWFKPRMNRGGVMVFDDYDWAYCPGVKQAIDEAGLTVEHTTLHQVAVRT